MCWATFVARKMCIHCSMHITPAWELLPAQKGKAVGADRHSHVQKRGRRDQAREARLPPERRVKKIGGRLDASTDKNGHARKLIPLMEKAAAH